MADRRNQNEENFEDYDPALYQGGYNQAEVYGPVKHLDDAVTAYAPAGFGELAEGGYGNSPSRAGRGPSGYSSYYQHTQPDFESAHYDYQDGAPYGGRRPSKGEPFEESYDGEGEWQGSRRVQQQQQHGYRKPTPAYGQSEEGSKYGGGYDQEQRPSYSRPIYGQTPLGYEGQHEQAWRGEQEEGFRPDYGRPHHKHYGEEDPQQQEGYWTRRERGEHTSEYAEEEAARRPSYW